MKNKVKVFKYPNGPTIIYSKSNSRFTNYQIGYQIDTLKEPTGLAHLVEHVVAIEHDDKNEKQTFAKQEQNGILSNAFTTSSFVTLYSNVNDKNIESAMKIDSAHLFNREFDDDKIEIEKKVVAQEGRDRSMNFAYTNQDTEDDDESDNDVDDYFLHTIYKHLGIKDPSAGNLVGNNERIRKYNKKTILRFIDRNFKPENMVFAINTAMPFEQVQKLFEKHFLSKCEITQTKQETDFPQEKLEDEQKIKNIDAVNNLYYQDYIPNLRTVSIELVYPTFENTYQNSAFALVDQVLFTGLNSRLMKQLRGKGLIYSCFTSKTFLDKDVLTTSIHTNTSNKNVNLVIDLIGQTIKDLVENGITDEEFTAFKNNVKNNKERAKEDVDGIDSDTLLSYYVLDMIDYLNFDDIKYAEKFTKEDINNYLVNLFKDNAVFVSVSGNYFPNKIYALNEIETILGAKESNSLLFSPANLFIKPNNEEFYDYDYNKKQEEVLLKESKCGKMGILKSNRISDKLKQSIRKILRKLIEETANMHSPENAEDEKGQQ